MLSIVVAFLVLFIESETANRDCSFEVDFCAWKNVNGTDNFDWIRHSGPTATAGTGPSNDHTLGDSKGVYAYIDTSGPRPSGERANLVSQQTNSTDAMCFSFWYSMHGLGTGNLTVYQKLTSGHADALWHLSGDQGTDWQYGSVDVKPSLDYEIIFEGISGTSYTGDIAVDDVGLHTFTCAVHPEKAKVVQMPTTSSTVALPNATAGPKRVGDCDFESSYCSWTNRVFNGYDWLINKGPTLSKGTGPDSDHTLGNKYGHYIYLEASHTAGFKVGELESPDLTPMNDTCMTFWYNMYGSGMGALRVSAVDEHDGLAIWHLKGDQGKGWHQGQAPVHIKSQYNIIFEGKLGFTDTNDMAVDDIKFREDKHCPKAPTHA